MVKEEADIEETEATWGDDTQTATNVFYTNHQVLLYFLTGSAIFYLLKKIWCNQIIFSIMCSIIYPNFRYYSS